MAVYFSSTLLFYWNQIKPLFHPYIPKKVFLRDFLLSGSEPRMLWYLQCRHWLPVDRYYWCQTRKLHIEGSVDKRFTHATAILLLSNLSFWWRSAEQAALPFLSLQLQVNPKYLVLEADFTNNVIRCNIYYSGQFVTTTNCKITQWVWPASYDVILLCRG